MHVQSSDEFCDFNEHQATGGNVVVGENQMILVFVNICNVNYEVLCRRHRLILLAVRTQLNLSLPLGALSDQEP